MSALFVAIPPGDEPMMIPIAEFPNYRYVAHEIELLGFSVPEWARLVMEAYRYFQPKRTKCNAWADPNTQFKAELQHYGINLQANHRKLELRTEIAREYMTSKIPTSGLDRTLMAPWLEILPYEVEHAKWPEGTTGSGKFERIKEHDHTLDGFEHAASRRPRSKHIFARRKKSFKERFIEEHGIQKSYGDPHLGVL